MLASWIQIPQKYANPVSRDHQPIVEEKTFLLSRPKFELLKKERF